MLYLRCLWRNHHTVGDVVTMHDDRCPLCGASAGPRSVNPEWEDRTIPALIATLRRGKRNQRVKRWKR